MKYAISDRAAFVKRILFAKALFVCLVALISLGMVFKSKASIQTGGVESPAAGSRKVVDLKEEGRQAVLHWMAQNSSMSEKVLSDIYAIARNTADADLVLAVCCVESNYNPHALSEKGAMGLMGIMPGVWLDELKAQGIVGEKDDLYKIRNNIAAGTFVLKRYISRTGNIRKALIRYEGGDAWYAMRVLKTRSKISLARHSREKILLASAGD